MKEHFIEFISKEKFLSEGSYPGIMEEKMRLILSEKINKIATDFMGVAATESSTDEMYLEKIKMGLFLFENMYLDTEDKERVCMYFEEIMDIVGLESSDGQLNDFIYGFDPS